MTLQEYDESSYISGEVSSTAQLYGTMNVGVTVVDSGGVSIVVDSALSETSKNPVQNKVITEKINDVEQRLDDLENSNNDIDYTNIINDDAISKDSTWSSQKISDAINSSVGSTTTDYNDLENKPLYLNENNEVEVNSNYQEFFNNLTPNLNEIIDDNTISASTTWSSDKIQSSLITDYNKLENTPIYLDENNSVLVKEEYQEFFNGLSDTYDDTELREKIANQEETINTIQGNIESIESVQEELDSEISTLKANITGTATAFTLASNGSYDIDLSAYTAGTILDIAISGEYGVVYAQVLFGEGAISVNENNVVWTGIGTLTLAQTNTKVLTLSYSCDYEYEWEFTMRIVQHPYGTVGDSSNLNSLVVDSELSDTSINPVQNKVITEKLNEVFQSVSEGKSLVASAITDKGVDTASDATFQQMAENIGLIKNGGDNLPYFELAYVETNGTQYFDTGVTPNSTTHVEAKFATLSYPTYGAHLLSSEGFYLPFSRPNDIFANRGGTEVSFTPNYTQNEPHVIEAYANDSVIIDRVNIGTVSDGGNYSGTLYMFTYGGNYIGADIFTGSVRMYYCKIWNNGELVRDFIPVIAKSDLAVCVYDKVTDTYYRSTNGTFTGGAL